MTTLKELAQFTQSLVNGATHLAPEKQMSEIATLLETLAAADEKIKPKYKGDLTVWRNDALAAVAAAHLQPLNLILYCPNCGHQHVDEPELPDWLNPPHKSHLCHNCKFVWRPADVATNGVFLINTCGSNDSKIPLKPTAKAEHLQPAVDAKVSDAEFKAMFIDDFGEDQATDEEISWVHLGYKMHALHLKPAVVDCRACAHITVDVSYCAYCYKKCTNGDKFQQATPLRLYRVKP